MIEINLKVFKDYAETTRNEDLIDLLSWVEETNNLLFDAAWCAWNDGAKELSNQLTAQHKKIKSEDK